MIISTVTTIIIPTTTGMTTGMITITAMITHTA